MADENLAVEALDKITGGRKESKEFGKGFANLSSTEKLAILGMMAGTGLAGYEVGTGGSHVKGLLGHEKTGKNGLYVLEKFSATDGPVFRDLTAEEMANPEIRKNALNDEQFQRVIKSWQLVKKSHEK